MIVDAQLHEPTVEGDWLDADRALRYRLMVETQLVAMRAVGVDRAFLFPIDEAWGSYAAAARPDAFGTVPMFTADGVRGTRSAASRDVRSALAELVELPGLVGLRIMMSTPGYLYEDGDPSLRTADPDVFSAVVEACRSHDLPLFVSTVGALGATRRLIETSPDVRVVIDHLGIPQRPGSTPDDPPFLRFDEVLRLAELPNAYAKVSGLPTLSVEAFPFPDLHARIRRLRDAFGAERMLWGTDISRVRGSAGFDFRVPGTQNGYPGRHTYAEAAGYLFAVDGLTPAESESILGGTACRLVGWSS